MDSTDHLIRAIDRARNIRVCAAITSGTVSEGARRHQLAPGAACALGRTLTSSVLLATLTKGDERVTVQLTGDGPLGSVTADATGDGNVRGYVLRPDVALTGGTGRVRVADVMGRRGVVNVLRDLGLKELYQGQVELSTGEIDEDIEAYLRTSEQVPSALGAEVVLADDDVTAAGGVLIQAMPGGEPDAVHEAQQLLRSGRLYDLLAEGERSPRALASAIYTLGPLEFIGDDRAIRFQCRCSPERITEMLALLGTVDLDEMIAEDKPAEVVCNFCNTKYRIGRAELERIRAAAAGRAQKSN